MSENRFWHLLAKKLSGEASKEEIQELEELMRVHPDCHYSAQHIEDIWGLSTKENPNTAKDAFLLHLSRMKKQGLNVKDKDEPDTNLPGLSSSTPNRNQKKKLLALAFITIAVVSAVYLFFPFSNSRRKPLISEVSTRLGSKSKLVLPDGSIVWLNAGSKLTYNKDFGNSSREVTLSGEAFFDVIKMPELPFIIETSSMRVKVLGTAFNIKAYPNEGTSVTSVIRGIVEVIPKQRPDEKFILKPNEKLVVSNEKEDNKTGLKQATPLIELNSLTYARRDSTILETSWVENKLAFDDESFSEIALKMERWYGVKIIFADKSIEQIRLSGSFTNETIQQAMDELEMTESFHYTIKQNTIIITK